MKSKRKRMSLIFAMLVVGSTFIPCPAVLAQDTSYTRFLLPFYLVSPAPGAYGSRWEVETWVHNAGTENAFMVPRALCPGITCMLGQFLEPGLAPWPVRVQLLLAEHAVLMHVDSRYAASVTFSSRIRDLSRTTESAGTSIPVIREDHLFAGSLILTNIPVHPAFRTMLRVYALPEVANPEVEVRYFRHPDARLPDLNVVLLRSERISLRRTTELIEEKYLLQPSMAERGNLQDLSEFAGHDAVWMEIVPVTPGLRFWAFISVTNNSTQEVTIITP